MATPRNVSAVISELHDYYIMGTVKPSDKYNDSYEVESDFEDQIISTRNKYLRDDIVVKKVQVSTTSNDAGGYTLNIGG